MLFENSIKKYSYHSKHHFKDLYYFEVKESKMKFLLFKKFLYSFTFRFFIHTIEIYISKMLNLI